MSILSADQIDYVFVSAAVPEGKWQVESFTGVEELSRPFVFRVVLVSEDGELDLDGPVGQPARLAIHGLTGVRYVHGVVERFEQRSLGRKYSHYEATLVPTVYPLKYTRNSRIFQKKSTLDIVKKVLQDGGYSPGQVLSESLHGKYGPRDYCVQYQESDYDFIARLLEEEGIFYFFEHSEDKDVLVVGDGKHAFEAVPGAATLHFRDEAPESVLGEEAIMAFRGESVMRPGGTVMRDFRFKQPGMDLEATQQADKFKELQVYYFPGEYVEKDMGKQLAKIRLEELQWDRQRFVGGGNSKAVLPGYRFMLAGHPRDKFNQEYLLVSVEQRASQPAVMKEEAGVGQVAPRAYQSRVVSIPVGVPFRPHRVTPRPTIFGVQSAVVVGPPGEEIHCDDHGRVKVQFHWDRQGKKNDDSSCWIRVSQPWGGGSFGGMFVPRVGHEVLVQFLEGDPDRPVIVGRVYNGGNPVPHGLPGTKMVSTFRTSSYPGGGGFNEIKMDDSAGKEEMFIHAQYNRNEIVGHDHTNTVTNDQTFTINGNQTQTVKKNQTLTVSDGNQTESIVAGASSLTVKNDRTVTVQSGDHVVEVQTGDSTHTVNTGDLITEIKTGDSTLQVNTGDHTTLVKTGNHTIAVNTGDSTIDVASGSHTASAKQAVTIESVAANLALSASTAGTLDADTIAITGKTKITLAVGGNSISIDSSGITIAGSKVQAIGGGASLELTGTAKMAGSAVNIAGSGTATLSGGGSVEITGAMVKIN